MDAASRRQMPTNTPLAGRQRELAFLCDYLTAAGRSKGGVVLVSGESGIGKTRLQVELAKQARDQGWAVLHGRAYDWEILPPYLPFIEALRTLGPFAHITNDRHLRARPPRHEPRSGEALGKE